MSVRSSSSSGETCGGAVAAAAAAVVRSGYYKKLKTSRKKFFVLRAETADASARLEYYDSEKKFNSGQPPKRSIPLKSCFNINKQLDTKHKHVIALYTKDDRFCIVLDTEEELDAWLKALRSLQHGEEAADGEPPRPTFEHVWQVTLLKRGLGSSYAKVPEASVYRLCLTDKVLSLIRKDEPQIELSLSSIRSCGSLKTYFYLEVGRSSTIGAGELWMETEDANIAHNVHQTVFHAMTSTSSSREELGPKSRNRSSSATESSKPTSAVRRQPSVGLPKSVPYTAQAGDVAWPGTVNHQRTRSLPLAQPAPSPDHLFHAPRAAKRSNHSSKCLSGGRERCDSMPSRARTTSEGNHIMPFGGQGRPYLLPHRPSSLYAKEHSMFSPSGSPVSPPSAAGSTDSAGSSLSIDDGETWPEVEMLNRYPHSLTPDEPIAEENCEDCTDGSYLIHHGAHPFTSSYVPMGYPVSDDGYVNMHPIVSPAASISSVTSGTPSTDMRFAEYPLEKVPSYFTPSEEDETSSADRPIRAYSFGSRPETNKYRSAHAFDSKRDRAYSCGAKTKTVHSRILPPHNSHAHTGPKSSSAPLLSGARLHGSHNSISSRDPMNDLMELDFTKKNASAVSPYVDMNKMGRTPPGYVEMRPGVIDVSQNFDKAPPRHVVPESYRNSRVHDNSPYVDMRPGTSPSKLLQENLSTWNKYNSNNHNRDQTPSGYVDMDIRRNRSDKTVVRSATSPLLPSPLSQTPTHNDYMYMKSDYVEMKPGRVASREKLTNKTSKSQPIDVHHHHHQHHHHHHQQQQQQQQQNPIMSGKLSFSPKTCDGSPSSIEYIDVDYPSDSKQHHNSDVARNNSESYVEMTPGHYKHSHDYANISASYDRKKDRKHSKKEKNRSQPIQIQTTSAPQFPKNTSPVFSLLGRKSSTEMSPKMYLQLSNSGYDLYSSLPRQKQRKNSRRDSKESSGSSVTTPSSSSTIFPISLNSPCSPVKPQQCDAKTPKPPEDVGGGDYTVMDFERQPKSKSSPSDYVNYNPGFQTMRNANSDYDDYALMKPTPSSASSKAPGPVTSNNVLVSSLNSITLGESKCFRPISESNESVAVGPCLHAEGSQKSLENLKNVDENLEMPKESRPNSVNSDKVNVKSRPGSVSSETTISSLSRPSSTSSEMGSTTSTVVPSRPSSVTSENMKAAACDPQLYYASLDLMRNIDEDGNRSPRTVKAQCTASEAAPSSSSVQEPEQQQQTPPPLPPSSSSQTTGFMYAKIDFVKSEGFKHNTPLPNNAKVKP